MKTPQVSPPEWKRHHDYDTGVELLQWTSVDAIHHHPYFTNCSMDTGGRNGYFISYRSGFPNLYKIDLQSGELHTLTDCPDINPFSPAPTKDGRWVYFSARNEVRKVDVITGEISCVARFQCHRLGICSLNVSETLLAISLRHDTFCELVVIDLLHHTRDSYLQKSEIGHVQFCPTNDALILFSGPIDSRLWLFDCQTGREKSLLAERPDQWITHESWLSGTEIIFSEWPRALRGLDVQSGCVRTISETNAWHSRANSSGELIVFDTNHPNEGLFLIESSGTTLRQLCRTDATSRGRQWQFSSPAAGAGIDTSILRSDKPETDVPPHFSMPESTYGPQWSHPHPSFSPDGKTIVFTSDRSLWSHVYSVQI